MHKAFHHWNTGKSFEAIDCIGLRNCFSCLCLQKKKNYAISKVFYLQAYFSLNV